MPISKLTDSPDFDSEGSEKRATTTQISITGYGQVLELGESEAVSLPEAGSKLSGSHLPPVDSPEGRDVSFIARFPRPIWGESYRERFERLKQEWKEETLFESSTHNICTHPAYQQIIGMGLPVVPLILDELERDLDHWFWALRSITGVNPVSDDERGNLDSMAESWLEWGKRQGLTLEALFESSLKLQNVTSRVMVSGSEANPLRS